MAADVGLRGEGESDDERGYGFFGKNLFENRQSLRSGRWAKPITYLHVFENDCFSVSLLLADVN